MSEITTKNNTITQQVTGKKGVKSQYSISILASYPTFAGWRIVFADKNISVV